MGWGECGEWRACADLPNGLARGPLYDGVRVHDSIAADLHERLQLCVGQQRLAAALGDLRDGAQRARAPPPVRVLGPLVDEWPQAPQEELAADRLCDSVQALQRALVQLRLPCSRIPSYRSEASEQRRTQTQPQRT